MESELKQEKVALKSIRTCVCPACSKALATIYNVRLHFQKFHPELIKVDENTHKNPEDVQKRDFQCPTCLEYFISDSHLQKHISKAHQAKENLPEDIVEHPNPKESADNVQNQNVDSNTSIEKLEVVEVEIVSLESEKKSSNEDKTNEVKIYQCHVCLRTFTKKDNLRRHMDSKTVHLRLNGEIQPYQKPKEIPEESKCSNCDRIFSNKHNLRRHILKNVCFRKIKEKPVVTVTSALTADNSTVTDNLRVQQTEPWRQTEMVCKVCNFKTYYPNNYNLHRTTPKHLEKVKFRKMQKDRFTRRFFRRVKKQAGLHFRQYRCFRCKRNSMYKKVVALHRQYRHKKIKPFQCSLCKKSYMLSRRLEMHMTKVHTALKPKRCFVNKCNRIFISPDLFGKHLSCVHKTEVSIIEEEVEDDDIVEVEVIKLAKLPSSAPFVIHKTSSNERQCRFCQVTCFNEVALINHLKRHQKLLIEHPKLRVR